MLKNSVKSIIVILVMGLVASNGYGALVIEPIPTPGSGSGGGSGSSKPINYPQSMNQNISLPGMSLYANVCNSPNENTSVNFWGKVDGSSFGFDSAWMNYHIDEQNPERFYFSAGIQLIKIPEFQININNVDFHEESRIHGLGVNVDSYLNVQNYEDGWWDEVKEEWNPIVTNDLELSYWMNSDPFEGYHVAAITGIHLSLSEWTND